LIRASGTRTTQLGLGFVAASLSAVVLYAALRLVQARLFPEADPATIIWSAHAGYFWRCWTAGYAGALVGFLAYGAAERHATSVARWLLRMLPPTVVLIVAQGLLVP
jgi:hypothetical protein